MNNFNRGLDFQILDPAPTVIGGGIIGLPKLGVGVFHSAPFDIQHAHTGRQILALACNNDVFAPLGLFVVIIGGKFPFVRIRNLPKAEIKPDLVRLICVNHFLQFGKPAVVGDFGVFKLAVEIFEFRVGGIPARPGGVIPLHIEAMMKRCNDFHVPFADGSN